MNDYGKREAGFYVTGFTRIESEDVICNSTYEYDAFDAIEKRRAVAFDRGDWHFVGLRVRAHCEVIDANRNGFNFDIDSAGLWGVESDSDQSHKDAIYAEEEVDLRRVIVAMRDVVYVTKSEG